MLAMSGCDRSSTITNTQRVDRKNVCDAYCQNGKYMFEMHAHIREKAKQRIDLTALFFLISLPEIPGHQSHKCAVQALASQMESSKSVVVVVVVIFDKHIPIASSLSTSQPKQELNRSSYFDAISRQHAFHFCLWIAQQTRNTRLADVF